MADKVTYHQEGGRDRVFAILAEHENGTVDIGPEGGDPVVTFCEMVDEPANGKATLIAAADKAEEPQTSYAESEMVDEPADEKSTKKNSKR